MSIVRFDGRVGTAMDYRVWLVLVLPSVMRALLTLALACAIAALHGCAADDIGKACPQLLGDESAGTQSGARSVTQEVVAQDISFPCEQMVCIATAGRLGYCTKACRENAGCPAGFECREIQPFPPFAGEQFCAWKPCKTAADCGKKGLFCCREALGATVAEKPMFCDFANNGKCE